ncbi:MAG: outer membrane protein assembly factor [Opitutales bacterium]
MRPHSRSLIYPACLFLLAGLLGAQTNLKIEGAGFWKNRSLKERLAFLQDLAPDEPARFDAALLEDSAFLLIEQLKRDGYLQPRVEAIFPESEGADRVEWTSPYRIQLDADAQLDAVTFRIDRGALAYYEQVEVEGITAIEPEELQRYFIPGGVLFQTRQARVFSSENLDRRIGRVRQTLIASGYGEARLAEQAIDVDAASGAVAVRLVFEQGPRHYVSRAVKVLRRGGVEREETLEVEPNTLLTQEWEQNQRSTLRNEAFAQGYPDVVIHLERKPADFEEDDPDKRIFDYRIIADWGEAARLGEVRFSGDEATSRKILRQRLELDEGDPLNRLKIDQARRKIMGLGIYRQVTVDYEPEAGAERDVIYTLDPSLRKELKMLGGWGSYEQARVGFKWEHRNPFGRAHRYQVEAKQSLRSTGSELTYTIPQVFGSNISLYSNAQYNLREEISFDRSNRGVSIGAGYTTLSGWRLAAEYGFFREEVERDDTLGFRTAEDASVSSVSLRASYDRRDNLLAPSSGWNVFSELKIANRWLGGSVDFHKLELGGSYHFSLTESTLLHLGLRGGVIDTAGDPGDNIPFSERFFPGGENSVRGYQQGEAAPLDLRGDQIGAETYAILNLELEQRIYSRFSGILFFDSLRSARDGFSGESELLHSLGLGLRYQTVIGPVRLEYGHNLNPREQDPNGTLHLSVGFPF